MPRLLRAHALAASIALVHGCYLSHERGTLDAGPPEDAAPDAWREPVPICSGAAVRCLPADVATLCAPALGECVETVVPVDVRVRCISRAPGTPVRVVAEGIDPDEVSVAVEALSCRERGGALYVHRLISPVGDCNNCDYTTRHCEHDPAVIDPDFARTAPRVGEPGIELSVAPPLGDTHFLVRVCRGRPACEEPRCRSTWRRP